MTVLVISSHKNSFFSHKAGTVRQASILPEKISCSIKNISTPGLYFLSASYKKYGVPSIIGYMDFETF